MGSKSVSRAEPYLRLVRSVERKRRLFLAGLSTTTSPSSARRAGRYCGEGWLEGVEHPVGRVDEDEIVSPARRGLGGESAPRVGFEDSRALQVELLQVALDRALGLAIGLDEDRGGSSAGERLEPHRARAGEEIEHGHVVHGPDQAERGLPHAVAGWSSLALRRRRSSSPCGYPR